MNVESDVEVHFRNPRWLPKWLTDHEQYQFAQNPCDFHV